MSNDYWTMKERSISDIIYYLRADQIYPAIEIELKRILDLGLVPEHILHVYKMDIVLRVLRRDLTSGNGHLRWGARDGETAIEKKRLCLEGKTSYDEFADHRDKILARTGSYIRRPLVMRALFHTINPAYIVHTLELCVSAAVQQKRLQAQSRWMPPRGTTVNQSVAIDMLHNQRIRNEEYLWAKRYFIILLEQFQKGRRSLLNLLGQRANDIQNATVRNQWRDEVEEGLFR